MRTTNTKSIQKLNWNWQEIMLLAIALLFFITYAYGNFLPPYWRAPDETANIFFSKLYANTYLLTFEEQLNDLTFGGVGPRHSRNVNSTVYPAGFIGMPATYGLFERLIPNSMFFITSIFGVLTVLFIYLIAREIINEEYAYISAIMLFFTAPFWYFSTVMYNNVPALALFIGGSYYLLKALQEDKWPQYILMGIFFGATILMRYEFLLFITLPLALVFITKPSHWKRTHKFLTVGCIMLIFFTPVLIFNAKILGNPLNVSYMSLVGEHKETFWEKMKHKIRAYILPNQLIPERIRESASRYIFRFFVPFWILALPGIAIAFHAYRDALKKHKHFLIFLAAYLLLAVAYFGGGRFHGSDKPIPIIHSSFVRYWMGWYVLAILLCTFNALALRNRVLRTGFLVMLAVINISILFHPQEGMLTNYSSTHAFSRIPAEVAKVTEPEALIFGDYWGKWVYPTRNMTAYASPQSKPFDAQTFASMLCGVHKKGIPVYVVPGSKIPPADVLQEYTNATCGLELNFTSNVMNGLYKAVQT
ncbi:MAG: glycosyltransferase family 39 protein [Candidatus Woesearchaeota archaeon]